MTTSVKLDPESSREALDQAIRTQTQLVLESSAFQNTTINGFLISGDDTALLMEVTGQPTVPLDGLLNVRCEGRLYGERRYEFSTTVQAVPTWGNSRCLALSRPRTIGLFERRRFLRAKLAPSTRVRVEWHRDGVDHHYVAAMLNISPEGLACRVGNDVAHAFECGGTLRLEFSLPPRNKTMRLCGTVSNKTPASEGYTILGLHFEFRPEDADTAATLRELLGVPRPVAVTEAYA
jgi:hypothetical protein